MAKDLSSLIKKIQKGLGNSAKITALSEVRTPYHIKRPTGILSLDLELHGGFPAGSLHQIHGPDGIGKDFLTNRIIAENQRIYGEDSCVFWMSFGYPPDRTHMRFSGVQVAYTDDDLVGLGYARETVDSVDAAVRGTTVGNLLFIELNQEMMLDKPAETLLDTVLELIASNECQIGIINELGSGETRHNVVKQLGEDPRMAAWSGLMTQFLQKMYSKLRIPKEDGSPNETTIFALNPQRANLNAMSAKFKPTVAGGGFALKHAKTIDLHMKDLGRIRKGTDLVGKKVGWVISKGKHGIAEGANGMYEFYASEGVDLVQDLARVAKAYGFIRNRGKHTYILDNPEPIAGGFDEGAVPLVRASPELQAKLRAAVLAGAPGVAHADDD